MRRGQGTRIDPNAGDSRQRVQRLSLIFNKESHTQVFNLNGFGAAHLGLVSCKAYPLPCSRRIVFKHPTALSVA
jgi:hypothetical protein